MKMRNVGKSGLQVSSVGLGCNNFGNRLDEERSRRVIDHAIDIGITLFDCADVYGRRGGAETILGNTLGARRKDIVLATKFGVPMDDSGRKQGGSRRYVMEAVEASLKRLRTEWIDLYILHVPDPSTPIEETLRALDDLVRSGKVRYVGTSGFEAYRLVEADWVAREIGSNRFICALQQYSLLAREIEAEVLPAMQQYGVGLIPFFPLAGGMLTGKYKAGTALPAGSRLTDTKDARFLNEANYARVAKLEAFASERGRTVLELAFSWLLGHAVVASVIAGATTPDQLDANAGAADWALSEDDYREIDRALAPNAA
jgi:aryl-alcohol dehydrogenase-like predicted oxidoreductase